MAGRDKVGRKDGRNEQVHECGGCSGEDRGVGAGAPAYDVDRGGGELGLEDLAAGQELPDSNCAIIAAGGEPDAAWVNGEAADATFVASVRRCAGSRERPSI